MTSEQDRQTLRATLKIMAVVLAIAVTATAQAVWSRSSSLDPHLDRARYLVSSYESSREETERNYGHPVYREALAELELVDPGSGSADPADRMRSRLTSRIRAFQKRQQSRDRVLAAQQRSRADR